MTSLPNQRFRLSALGAALSLMVAAPAYAQSTERVGVAVAYQDAYVRGSDGVGGGSLPIGLSFSVGERAVRSLEILEDFGFSHRSGSVGFTPVGATIVTFSGGARLAKVTGPRDRVFAELLAGVGRVSIAAGGVGAGTAAFVVSPGGGFEFGLGAKSALQVRGDFGVFRRNSRTLKAVQLRVGVLVWVG